ncbi:LysM peptidoglycan-binding domain-containing protein [Saccharicrinis fermentans]|uniref:Spore coat assembly protein SafA n=1 Tax=Saccharicrinis fermentans DSM 9555 = JCM 21142 TaxID=869213 RepID=W7YKY5_9BACT|nr:LysM domain-containing protein [Saccharicrinis fermentans]GAF03024.1 spore coat assembly protein SafA [Saccharicrinis fermentans DSM 9555 = JCM 21142]
MEQKPDTIDSARLKQLIDFNVSYGGYVDDGFGTMIFIDRMDIIEDQYQHDNVLYYKKTVNINISEVSHTVKKGDNLSVIANKLGVKVEQIVNENNIKNPNLIYPGDVITVKTNLQYGYQASSMVNLADFEPLANNEAVYKPLSSEDIFEGLNYVNSAVDALAGSLKDNARNSTIGNNRKIYWEKPSGRAFRGNQYVKTYGLKGIGTAVKKVTPWIAVGLEAKEVYGGYEQDGGNFGHNAQKQFVGGVASIGGAFMGAKMGAAAGMAIGVWIGGVGSIPGAIIGAFVGGLIGALVVGTVMENSAESAYDIIVPPETKLIQP